MEDDGKQEPKARPTLLDCDAGRAMGCESFCCALLVRLGDGECDPTSPTDEKKSCIDKDPETGRCIHQDVDNGRCGIWEQRPRSCRQYDCNRDEHLQKVLQNGFKSLMKVLLSDYDEERPKQFVPYLHL
jgi:Fe-S-cluster containining protein